MPTIVGDVKGLQQPRHPLNIPHLVKKIKRFPVKVKAFQNTATYPKLRGGVRNKKKVVVVERWPLMEVGL